MTSVVVKQTKPNSASFYELSEEFNKYMDDTYINTGKLTVTKTVNGNNEVETVLSFASNADRIAYVNDPIVLAQRVAEHAHNQAAAISASSELNQ